MTWAAFVRRHRAAVPYLLLAPGLLWLAIFYVYPAIQMFISSFWTGYARAGLRFSLSNWTTYPEALDRYSEQFGRSLLYAAAATVLTFLIAYPLAYTIAFRGGRYRNLMLFLVVAPFFTSFLLRTVSWKIILGRRRDAPGSAQGPRPSSILPSGSWPRRSGSSSGSRTTSCRS